MADSELKIFSNIVARDDADMEERVFVKSCMKIFKNAFPYNIFKNEYYVLYSAITEANRFGGTLKVEHFKSILINSIDELAFSDNIDLSMYDECGLDEKKQYFGRDCLTIFQECQQKNYSIEEFRLDISVYIKAYKRDRLSEIIINTYKINNEGLKIKGQNIVGAEEASLYYQKETAKLASLLAEEDTFSSSIRIDSGSYKEYDDEVSLEPLSVFGLDEIDSVIKNFYRTEVVTILGESGKGKTRNAVNIAYNAMLRGHNVLWYPLEGSSLEVEAMFVARHFAESRGITPVSDREIISRSPIFFEYRKLIESSRKDLYMNPNLGKLYIAPTNDFIVENMQAEFEGIYADWLPFDVAVIDYMSLAQSNTMTSTTEIVSKGTKLFKNICTNFKGKGLLGILPHQLKDEAVQALRAGKDITTYSSSDSGEIVKTADFSVAINATDEMEKKNQLEYIIVKKRHIRSIPKFTAFVSLGSCLFASDNLN